MPPSQLKRLKASLREQGITGQQKSKKQKNNSKKGKGAGNGDERARRQAALAGIRESFNPFDVKMLSRPRKFEVTSRDSTTGKNGGVLGRPGASRSAGEEARRRTLLVEMQRRNKVGGIVDRRIGENDPTMTPEERMMQRFAREKQSRKGASLFDLEVGSDEEQLTHGGRTLAFGEDTKDLDDFDAGSLADSSGEESEVRLRKRDRRALDEEDEGNDAQELGEPERKKTKSEVMKEVIAKSKLHKYERQHAKEEDDDLRAELDKDLSEVLAALQGQPAKPARPETAQKASGTADTIPDGEAVIPDVEKSAVEREYDLRLRELAQDQRSKPTERTKTDEEKVKEHAEHLERLERKRLRRMRGEADESDEEGPVQEEDDIHQDSERDDAAEFGFTSSIPANPSFDVEDEDEFEIDEDLLASGSDLEPITDEEQSEEESGDSEAEDDDEFVRNIISADEKLKAQSASASVAFAYPCPRTHEELLSVLNDVPVESIPTVVQRIRALYHPQLATGNKEKLSDFAVTLVQHLPYLSDPSNSILLSVLESVTRHIHSLSRTYSLPIAEAFRAHLRSIRARAPDSEGSMTRGDLAVLTAITTIYPTSDYFHPVVTPASTLMARHLGLRRAPRSAADLAVGAVLLHLVHRAQKRARRYVPEAIRWLALSLQLGQDEGFRASFGSDDDGSGIVKVLEPYFGFAAALADLWADAPSFRDIFAPKITAALLPYTLRGARAAAREEGEG
ncbi:nucleolar protein 14 [Lineolata rhizophorae]|uniref:Nucleolar protein 14 n=1 Tax=Lineolata rhizophorae TaxID=578093 RepID=A0A6A6P9H4_9PEZI|nr:nucleolar protein 14 [Lineolata rhizophorae]